MLGTVEALLASTLDYAPPLVFAAVGATWSERAGVVNVGVEGMMRAGAFAAAAAALIVPTPLGLLAGMAAGALLAAVHAFLCLRWRSDQVVSGMALNLVALAGGAFLLEVFFAPNGTPPIAQLERWVLPVVDPLPVLRGLSRHSGLTYLAMVVPFAAHAWLSRTPGGLRLRAVGDGPAAATAAGVPVLRTRAMAVGMSGLLAGLGGAALSTSTLDRFEHHMPSGLGFMAVAAMVFGRWTPLGAAAAATFFAFAGALRVTFASSHAPWLAGVPQGFWMALPYALTLALLAFQRTRTRAPRALGVPYLPGHGR